MQAVVSRLTFFRSNNCDLSFSYRMKCLHYCADFVVSGLWGAHFYAAYLLKSPPPKKKKKKENKRIN